MAKRRGLGRGLDALLSSVNEFETATENGAGEGVVYPELALDLIEPGRYQPRRNLEPQALEELANSIRSQGLMQPIVVRPVETSGRYEIIAGERRWRASQMAGLNSIPVIIKEVADEAAIAMALIENVQREDLNPMEEAIALQRLQKEFQLTQQEVADAVGKSRSTVTNLLRLMNLSDPVRKMLEYGDLEMGHARALLPLNAEEQFDAAKNVVGKGLSVRQTEDLVRKKQSAVKTTADKELPDTNLDSLAEQLSSKLDAKVKITTSHSGKGKITISYASAAALDKILNNL